MRPQGEGRNLSRNPDGRLFGLPDGCATARNPQARLPSGVGLEDDLGAKKRVAVRGERADTCGAYQFDAR